MITEFKAQCPICKTYDERMIAYGYKFYCINCYTLEIIKEYKLEIKQLKDEVKGWRTNW